jgi:hypothetical protein
MDWFSVHLEARTPSGTQHEQGAALDASAADELMDLLTDYDGIVSAGTGSWDVTISVEAPDSPAAAARAVDLIAMYGHKAGMPPWPPVRIEAVRQDILDAENARPTLPELVSAPEAADILRVSPQRLHQLASENASFPEPMYDLRAGKLWLRAAVEAFASRERKPGRPRRTQAAAG